ncbi:unnamed protein product [Linum trigynum]|uniref:Uncharacterized protein n=1 Tax=Linum trigynum TaxID=586398 RepID=A0AAV2DXV5_9ROSI
MKRWAVICRRKARLEEGGASLPGGGARRARAGGPAHTAWLEDAGPERKARKSGPQSEEVRAMVSADSESEDEAHCFEIKKRAPFKRNTEPGANSKGRVCQVVAAFEAGLTINSEKTPAMEGQEGGADSERKDHGRVQDEPSELDEYGSNLVNPDIGTRKRIIDEVEGELGDAPTPKKQFVEVADNLDQVEEASLKWPQSDI